MSSVAEHAPRFNVDLSAGVRQEEQTWTLWESTELRGSSATGCGFPTSVGPSSRQVASTRLDVKRYRVVVGGRYPNLDRVL